MRSDAANKAYSKHAYAIMFCHVLPLIQGFQSGTDSPSLWGGQDPLALLPSIQDEVGICSRSCRTHLGSGRWRLPEQQLQCRSGSRWEQEEGWSTDLPTLTSGQVVHGEPAGKGSLLPVHPSDTRYLAKFPTMWRSRGL